MWLLGYLFVAIEDQSLGFEWVGTRLPPQVDGVNFNGLVTQLVHPTLEVQQLIGDVLKQNSPIYLSERIPWKVVSGILSSILMINKRMRNEGVM